MTWVERALRHAEKSESARGKLTDKTYKTPPDSPSEPVLSVSSVSFRDAKAKALTEASAVVAAEVASVTARWGVSSPTVGAVGWTTDGKMCRRCHRIAIVRRCDFVCSDCTDAGAAR